MSERVTAPDVPPDVLVVDDVEANRELLEAHLLNLGYAVRQARDGVEALEAIDEREPDLVLLDVDMPRLDGIAVCRRIKDDLTRRLIPVVLLTAHQDRDTRFRGLAAGADDFVTKPFDKTELLIRTKVLLRERDLNKQLDVAETIVMTLARIVEARDRYTVHHAERVGLYARAMADALDLPYEDRDVLYRGGVLHDLGKIVVPAEILLKQGPLTDAERRLMEEHAPEGARICGSLRSIAGMLPIIRHHHERVDGAGYPDHLAGEDIPLAARIAAVADAWDAMTSDRPYRLALERDEALRRLAAGAGSQWDAGIAEVFRASIDRGLMERVAAQQRGPTGPGVAAAD